MMATNTINIAVPFRQLNEDEMSSMYRCDSIHGEGVSYSMEYFFIKENSTKKRHIKHE